MRLTPPVDISQYNAVAIAVNVHSRTVGTSAKLEILALADSTTDWAVLVNPTALAIVTIDSTTAPPIVLRDALDATDLPASISIWVKGTQPAQITDIEAEIEVDLILRQQ